MSNRLNRYSATLTQDETQPASQAMLYGAGLTDEDMQKAQVAVASTGFDGNTCNMHLNGLADASQGKREGGRPGGLPVQYHRRERRHYRWARRACVTRWFRAR